ncbi:lasso peptide biosynthesis PqqD family chaperone [Streptomyces chrestomyceticus]|uniref:lasso peptide biosynthesis PqqD family chaperone n=1 Tax=Streptomyces chrestomyceticus TaxID=68185 RepID=UPI0019D08490|nr:lasso peptide biosynthesis PqqD family chaperone [Streptomyces chrestomyceticus]
MPLRLHPDVTSADTDDGTVLLHLGTGRYWQLNATGAAVLRHLLDGDEPDRVAAALAVRHGIEADRAARDVHAVVGQLRAAKLVITS